MCTALSLLRDCLLSILGAWSGSSCWPSFSCTSMCMSSSGFVSSSFIMFVMDFRCVNFFRSSVASRTAVTFMLFLMDCTLVNCS